MSYNAYDKDNDEIIKLADGFPTVDAVPTEGSIRPVSSGGVYDSVEELNNNKINITELGTKENSNIAEHKHFIGDAFIAPDNRLAIAKSEIMIGDTIANRVVYKGIVPSSYTGFFYNANTDRTIESNRKTAIEDVLTYFSNSSYLFNAYNNLFNFSVRYQNGYYFSYYLNGYMIMEIAAHDNPELSYGGVHIWSFSPSPVAVEHRYKV